MAVPRVVSLNDEETSSWHPDIGTPPGGRGPVEPRVSGGGGNRTRVRGRTGQGIYERSPRLISPGGRFADDQPTGQPS